MTRERLQQAAKMGEIRERLDAGEPLSLDNQNWLFAAIDTVYNENHRLRGALEKYGRHYGGCTEHRCYCGLAAALAGSSEPTAVVISPPP